MNHPQDIRPQPAVTNTPSKDSLRGVLLPFTTPFKANDDLDVDGLRDNIRKWNKSGIVGYVALGSTGERVNLNEREYLEAIEVARAAVPPDLVFIVGVGQQSTRGTIEEIKRATAVGGDAVLVITPHFYRSAMTQEALLSHYLAVADDSPVPIILYSMPDLTGIKIEPQTVAQLSTHQNIIGLKDSSADMTGFRDTVRLTGDDFAVLVGNGTVFLDGLSAGGCGGVLAVGCVAAAVCMEIYRLSQVGDEKTATIMQEKLRPLALAVTKRYGISGLKAALDIIGFAGGGGRAPLKPASEAARLEIAGLLSDLQRDESSYTKSMDDEIRVSGAIKA
ncbi:MAG: dihydrodipicolinate synthase family protein [Pyrinomonadaceae bacterium]